MAQLLGRHCPGPMAHSGSSGLTPCATTQGARAESSALWKVTQGRKSHGSFWPDQFIAPLHSWSHQHRSEQWARAGAEIPVKEEAAPHQDLVAKPVAFWHCSQCHLCSLSSLLRGLLGRSSEGCSDTIPNKFLFCSYSQLVGEHGVDTTLLRCPSSQLPVQLGHFFCGIAALVHGHTFCFFLPQTLTAKIKTCCVHGYHISWP